MNKKNKIKAAEVLLIILIWVIIVAAPVLFRGSSLFRWEEFLRPLHTLIPLFIIFLINRFVLVPFLLFRKQHVYYILSVVVLIVLFTVGSYKNFQNRRPAFRQQMNAEQQQFFPKKRFQQPLHRRNRGIPPYTNVFIFSILLVGFDTGLRFAFRLSETEQEKAELEKENIGTQMAFLKNQVSPHFLMNTLNNIHALIDINTDEAKDAIIRLSKLMRHLIYDSETEKITIQKEIDFIRHYVELMKLRFSDKVDISLLLENPMPEKTIPPLLFTSYVENAFKHGISYEQDSFVEIIFSFSANSLTCTIKNSIVKKNTAQDYSGIGMENARKRLDLLYGSNYKLIINESNNVYSIQLTIPL